MTDTMTPADELRAAADKLRTLATAATPGPWHSMRWHSSECPTDCDDPSCFMLIVTSARSGIVGDADADRDSTFHVERSVHERGEDDAAFIAAMHPGVGAALADWLHAMATWAAQYPEMAHDHDRPSCDDYACNVMGRGIDLARQILGTQSDGSPR